MNDAPTLKKHPNIDTVLVIGPNGNVGSHLVPRLLELGYNVRALQFNSPVPERSGQEIVPGNTLDADSLKSAVEGVDAVCHLIRGSAGPGTDQCEKWFNCCLQGAVNLLEAAKGQPLKRFITGSADNVFGHTTMPHHGPITEGHPKRFADGYYGLFKIAEEELCRQYYLGFDVPLVITRFPLIWTKDMLGSLVGSLDRKKQVIRRRLDRNGTPHIRQDAVIHDIVQGVLLALFHDEAVGQDFNFSGPAPYSSEQLARVLKGHFDWPVEDQPTDWYPWAYDAQKAKDVLGYRPQHDVLEWIDKHLEA